MQKPLWDSVSSLLHRCKCTIHWWVKRFRIGKITFFPQNGHQLKKMTNKPFAAQWDVFNKVYQHTSNSHPWSPPLKCVLKYEKHRLRRKVASSNTYRANHNKVSSSWQPKLDILKRGGEQDSIFFLLSQTFSSKGRGKIDLSSLHIIKYLHISHGTEGPVLLSNLPIHLKICFHLLKTLNLGCFFVSWFLWIILHVV